MANSHGRKTIFAKRTATPDEGQVQEINDSYRYRTKEKQGGGRKGGTGRWDILICLTDISARHRRGIVAIHIARSLTRRVYVDISRIVN